MRNNMGRKLYLRTFGCGQRIAAMPTIRGMSIRAAMSTTTTPATRIGSPRLCRIRDNMAAHSAAVSDYRHKELKSRPMAKQYCCDVKDSRRA